LKRASDKVAVTLAGVLWVTSVPAAAMTVEHLEVGERTPGYFVEFAATLSAPPAAVMAVLQSYESYPELDPRIVAARVVGEQDGQRVLYTRLKGCLAAWFCRDMERYELLEESASRLVARAVPGRGDLGFGFSETRVEPAGEGTTRVRYSTWFEPSFWMPRWLVRAAMIRTLRTGTLAMFENVETRASEASP
jgi:hypothetical protein